MHDAAQTQQEQYADHAGQHGQRDVADLLTLGRAVDLGRLKDLLIHARERGQIHDRAVARALPDVDDGQDGRPVLRGEIPVDWAFAHGLEDVVEHTGRVVEQRVDDIGDGDEGDERGHDHDGLRHLGIALEHALVKRNGQRHIGDRAHSREQEVVAQGVPHDARRDIHVGDEHLEVGKAAPGAAQYALAIIEGLEGDGYAVHRHIVEHENQYDARQRHDDERPVPKGLPEKMLEPRHVGLISPSRLEYINYNMELCSN